MKFTSLAAGMIAALLMTSTAHAVSITNRDDREIKLTIIEGDVRQEQVIQSGKVIEGVCQKGCIIRLNDSDNDEYELEGSEAVSVEEGFLYYDTPLDNGAPQGGSTGPADTPKSE
ncbi:MAG: hypothetical protein JNL45_02055 [Hyphomicrobium sp.]|nr:hypothetical protein [Hyphomicrobium sp.]